MCVPMAVVGIAGQVIGGIMQYQASQAAADAAEAQARAEANLSLYRSQEEANMIRLNALRQAQMAEYEAKVAQNRAQAQANEAAYAAQVQRNNAELARRQAEMEGDKGLVEQQSLLTKGEAFKGAQTAALGASGVEVSGSGLSLLTDTAMGVARDVAIVGYDTMTAKWGLLTEAAQREGQARVADLARESALQEKAYMGRYGKYEADAALTMGAYDAERTLKLGRYAAENRVYGGQLEASAQRTAGRASLISSALSVADTWSRMYGSGGGQGSSWSGNWGSPDGSSDLAFTPTDPMALWGHKKKWGW